MRGLKILRHALQSIRTKPKDRTDLIPNVDVAEQYQPKRPAPGKKIKMFKAERFVVNALTSMDVPEHSALYMAESMIAADYMGHQSMGIRMLPAIAEDLVSTKVAARAIPRIVVDMGSLALVNGHNAPGAVVANFCMELALQMAGMKGIGWVAARNCNSIGLGLWYAMVAKDHNMIGVCMSNEEPTPMFTGSWTQERFIADLGKSACSVADLALSYYIDSVQQGQELPAFDSDGKEAQTICSLQSEAKKFGQMDCNAAGDVGLVYIAIDPAQFSTSFGDSLSDFDGLLRAAEYYEEGLMPLMPGDYEIAHMKWIDQGGGNLCVPPRTLAALNELANKLDIEMLENTPEEEEILY